jgi:hypothetical protein
MDGGQMAPASMGSLVSQADAIVTATIVQGDLANGAAALALSIDDVLKGRLLVDTTRIVSWRPPYALPQATPITKRRGMFFLKNTGDRDLMILPCTSGAINLDQTYIFVPPGPRPRAFGAPSSVSALDKVLLTIAWAMQVGVPPGGGVVDLAWEYRQCHSAVLKPVLDGFVQSSVPRLATTGLRALLSDGDVGALQQVEAQQSGLLQSGWGSEIATEIKWYFTNSSSVAIAVLGRLAVTTTTVPALREGAASALARVHTRDAMLFLAALLSDPSPTLRTYAVGGLSSFANNVPVGSHEPAAGAWRYRTDETIAHSAMIPANADFWLSWWSANRHDIMQGR